jgi:hypothetical protein
VSRALALLAAVAALAPAASPAGPPCSARGLHVQLPAQQLPAAVASTRRRLFAAALRCDYAALSRLADEHGRGLEFSFGAERSATAYWSAEERRHVPVMRSLALVLTLPYSRYGGFYAWPSAYRDRPTDADWQALRRLYPQRTIDAMRRGGIGYSGWRAGIRPSGDWQFFVTGD